MILPELAGTALDGQTVSLRDRLPGDEPFLIEMFHSAHFPELPVEETGPLVRMQMAAQRAGYERQFPGTDWSIIRHGEKNVGIIWIGVDAEAWYVADMAMHPDARGTGVGSVAVRHLIKHAHANGMPVRASALRANEGSIRLQLRLGFQIASEDEVFVHFEIPVK